MLTRKTYAFIADMHEGRAVFNDPAGGNGSSRYGYLDPEGHEAIAAQFAEAGDYSGGKAVVKIRENEYALIDRNGRRLATYPYAYVGPIGEGLLAFQKVASAGSTGTSTRRAASRSRPLSPRRSRSIKAVPSLIPPRITNPDSALSTYKGNG